MNAETPAIKLQGLTRDYGSFRALDGLDLQIERGEVFGFLGPNGAGKTTTIRILFDLIRPTTGQAAVMSFDCQQQGLQARSQMGYLPGDLNLYRSLRGEQVVELFAALRGSSLDNDFMRDIVRRLDIDLAKKVADYSRGNRQKLGILLATMHQPSVLVLDEPTSGLDPLVHEEVTRLFQEMAARGTTVFFSSHVLSEVGRMCDRVGIIRQGRLVAVEEVAALKGRSLHLLEVTFDARVPADAFALPGVKEVERDGNTVHLEVRENLDAALKAIGRYPVLDLRTEQPSLEHIFMAYYEAGANEKGEVAADAAPGHSL